MIRNYLAITLRVLRKNPLYSAINILGLALGLACCLLIMLFVRYERSFDTFHENGDRLFRLNKVVTPQEGGSERHALSSGPMGPALVEDYPEVADVTRVLPWFDEVLLVQGETAIKAPDVLLADANFFETFGFEMLRGDPATVLETPMAAVLTETTARSLFGKDDPIGKTIAGLNDLSYTVTGIAADPPLRSHIRFDAILSWASTTPGSGGLHFDWLNRWLPQAIYTYVLMAPGVDRQVLEAKLPDFMARRFAERAEQYHLYLQPLPEIYLGSSDVLYNDRVRQGDQSYVSVFTIVAVLILLIACINFMNLVTARAARRAKEVGIRKSLGARRSQLASQFLGEAALTTAAALGVALLIVELARPVLGAAVGKPLSFSVVSGPWLFGGLIVLPLFVALISGSYPALVLSGFRPAHVLKGFVGDRSGSITLRRVLVTAQFAISIGLVAATIVIYSQMRFLQGHDLGFDSEQVVVLPIGNTAISGQFEAFKSELLRHPAVSHAAGSNSVPGQGMSSFQLEPEGKPDTETWMAWVIRADDFDLIETYRMSLADGRYLSPDFLADTATSVVVNESLVRMLGWTDPIGKRLDVRGETSGAQIVGVVKDYNFESLRTGIDPLLIYLAPRGANLSVRIAGTDVPGALRFLEETWKRFDSLHPFEYSFVDESFAAMYLNEQRLMQTLSVFSILAIVIACLGLVGLASYTAERRTKEIGVRKVLGASAASIVLLLSREFVRLLILALCIATPVGYVVMRRWLDGFAYRVDLGATPFLVAGCAAILVAMFTVGHQSFRAAIVDPARSLRYE